MKKYIILIATVLSVLTLTACHRHDYAPATCTEPSTCTKCEKTQGESLGHDMVPPTCEAPATCTRCGLTLGDAMGHSWVEATCESAKICSTCGKTEGKALGHDYTEMSCVQDRVCNRCGDVIKAKGHLYKEATCEKPKTCTVCHQTEGQALGHDIVEGKCTRCGLEISSVDAIKKIAGLKAGCETDYYQCVVDADVDPSEGNPYDVIYDYGEVYNEYVALCDWTLIFDADYYMKTYPILTTLYHKDKNLLLQHFQTVGIHEGRQANATFNVAAYMDNCGANVKEAFGTDYAAYAIYYLLNYENEKGVEHTKLADGKIPAKQQTVVLTVMQSKEFKEINNYRDEVKAQALEIDPELCAYANYRAWMNAHDDWAAHDWAKQNNDAVWKELNTMGASSMAENTVTSHSKLSHGEAKYVSYRYSKEHYDALIKTKYNYFGTSHFYNSKNENLHNTEWKSPYVSCTFDCFTDKAETAYN